MEAASPCSRAVCRYAETRERGKCWQMVSRQRCLHVYVETCFTRDRLHAKDALPVSLARVSGEKVAGLVRARLAVCSPLCTRLCSLCWLW